MYKISVIMPIYNAEDTLNRSIPSIINQTIGFENIELILVDDNSSDNSRKIMEDYSSKYSNIKNIFLKTNHGGPSIPRNEGMKVASSDYLMFIDNDDEFDSRICEIFYNKITQYDVDCISCSTCEIGVNGNRVNQDVGNVPEEVFIENEDILSFGSNVIWNKIFKKEIILKNNIWFPNYRNEDWYFSFMYFVHCKSLLNLPHYNGYNYYLISDSLSKSSNFNQLCGILDLNLKICKELNEMNIDPIYYFNPHKHSSVIYSMCSKRLLEEPDEKLYALFEKFIAFEEELDCSDRIGIIFDIGKYLLMNRHFKLAKLYFKLLVIPKHKISNSPFIKKIVRKFV